jgi:hypothetical protein
MPLIRSPYAPALKNVEAELIVAPIAPCTIFPEGKPGTLVINGAEYGRKLVSESGTFVFDEVNLSEGDNDAYAYTATLHDLQSEKSKNYVIVLDTTKPTVNIEGPKDGEVFRGQSQRITNFVGSVTEPGSKLYIGERLIILTTEGKFSTPYQLVEGDQDIQIKIIDKAGNENLSSIKLRWEP